LFFILLFLGHYYFMPPGLIAFYISHEQGIALIDSLNERYSHW
jgi:hypothetical protein